MGNFITGILVENEDGATYEGVVYDRFLKLRLPDGQVVSIFDPNGPISTGLPTGEVYEMVLVTFAVSVSYFPTNPPALEADHWQGTVINSHWRAPEGNYGLTCEDLFNQEWMLIATPLGQLLMSTKEIKTPIDAGGFIQWKNVRLDLYAVV